LTHATALDRAPCNLPGDAKPFDKTVQQEIARKDRPAGLIIVKAAT